MIYIVEDDQSINRGFELFLESAGMEFRTFQNANDFLSACEPNEKDILILDLNLPKISGFDLLKKLDHKGLHIPVIVVTAFNDEHSRQICKQYGVKAYLRKPVDGEAIIDLIKFNQPHNSKSE